MDDKPARLRQFVAMTTDGAFILREQTGTSGLERTLRDAVVILSHHLVPHLVAGGLAVQEHGYFRVTLDVDIIVPDPQDATELLVADLGGPFRKIGDCEDAVEDKRNGAVINLLPAGRAYKRACKVMFPLPTEVTDVPRFISLEQLISLKLDSWVNSPHRRHKDKTDVIELIKALKLPRGLTVEEPVRHLYVETWDALQAEPE
jgi:hypothetical protein